MKNIFKDNWGKKAQLLMQHLRPAASALLLVVGASLVLTLLRVLFTQVGSDFCRRRSWSGCR